MVEGLAKGTGKRFMRSFSTLNSQYLALSHGQTSLENLSMLVDKRLLWGLEAKDDSTHI